MLNGVPRTLVGFMPKHFVSEDPLGRQIRISMLETLPEAPVQDAVFAVVGVVADARNQGIYQRPMPEMFAPYTVTGAFRAASWRARERRR